jgi:hypothetical protein
MGRMVLTDVVSVSARPRLASIVPFGVFLVRNESFNSHIWRFMISVLEKLSSGYDKQISELVIDYFKWSIATLRNSFCAHNVAYSEYNKGSKSLQ